MVEVLTCGTCGAIFKEPEIIGNSCPECYAAIRVEAEGEENHTYSEVMSEENTVVSGRYFAGIWKCWLYPIFTFVAGIVLIDVSENISWFLIMMAILSGVGGFIAAMWFLHADAANLRKTHGLNKGALGYIIAFMFIGYWSVLIYYWTRNGLIQKAGMTQESLTWKDRILPYKNRNNIPSR